jgi:hypothetical protein
MATQINLVYRITTENMLGGLPARIVFNGVTYRPTDERDAPGYTDAGPPSPPQMDNARQVLSGKILT